LLLGSRSPTTSVVNRPPEPNLSNAAAVVNSFVFDARMRRFVARRANSRARSPMSYTNAPERALAWFMALSRRRSSRV
jgi:hypothetical protein